MRRRLALLFVLSSAAAGCSLLVDFDRGKIPAFEETDGAPDGATVDGSTDAPHTDGGGGDVEQVDAPVTDAPVTDAPVTDAPVTDAPVNDAADAGDANTNDANTTDANTTDANTTDANDAATNDASDAADAAADAADANDDAADAADASISQYCSAAEFAANDLTAQSTAAISFPTTATPAQYSPHCIRIKAGTTVTFSGDFSAHPLTEAGGSASSPIPASTTTANDGGAVGDVDVTFPNAGTYDFRCGNHPTIMNGGVEVVP